MLFSLFILELLLHSFFIVAIKNAKSYSSFSPLDFASVGYWNLKVIWLKLMVIWRFSRFWALLDNIESVENMNRCMTNNYSCQGFWRSWHRSYNQWIIRHSIADS